jgi:3-oxoacyl-[acyl-carrier-protein] synthase II
VLHVGEALGSPRPPARSCDAHHMTDPRADGLGVSTCIELALKVGSARECMHLQSAQHSTVVK